MFSETYIIIPFICTVLETRLADVDVQFTNLVFLLRDPAQLVPQLKLILLNKQLNQLDVASDVLSSLYMQLENFTVWKLLCMLD